MLGDASKEILLKVSFISGFIDIEVDGNPDSEMTISSNEKGEIKASNKDAAKKDNEPYQSLLIADKDQSSAKIPAVFTSYNYENGKKMEQAHNLSCTKN